MRGEGGAKKGGWEERTAREGATIEREREEERSLFNLNALL